MRERATRLVAGALWPGAALATATGCDTKTAASFSGPTGPEPMAEPAEDARLALAFFGVTRWRGAELIQYGQALPQSPVLLGGQGHLAGWTGASRFPGTEFQAEAQRPGDRGRPGQPRLVPEEYIANRVSREARSGGGPGQRPAAYSATDALAEVGP